MTEPRKKSILDGDYLTSFLFFTAIFVGVGLLISRLDCMAKDQRGPVTPTRVTSPMDR